MLVAFSTVLALVSMGLRTSCGCKFMINVEKPHTLHAALKILPKSHNFEIFYFLQACDDNLFLTFTTELETHIPYVQQYINLIVISAFCTPWITTVQ